MTRTEMKFGFGRNWERFIQNSFSIERVEIAQNCLLDTLRMGSLRGKYFLDVGCGSGLHSLAAVRSGAEKVVSFDCDPDSVRTTLKLRALSGDPDNWIVKQGSILDPKFAVTLEPADIVYAWGVLHHTGNMWQAMDNTALLLRQGALLCVALYDYEIHVSPPPEFWLDVKRRYNRSGPLMKRYLELWYIRNFLLIGKGLSKVPNFIRWATKYKESRGMSFYTDIVDWLGGWPMEFAKRSDVAKWATDNNLSMLTMKTGEANTEYLFLRPESQDATSPEVSRLVLGAN